ncbi:MAG: hypothetical protein R3B41_04205 [Candidatus Doudnabacteria bacterium]
MRKDKNSDRQITELIKQTCDTRYRNIYDSLNKRQKQLAIRAIKRHVQACQNILQKSRFTLSPDKQALHEIIMDAQLDLVVSDIPDDADLQIPSRRD